MSPWSTSRSRPKAGASNWHCWRLPSASSTLSSSPMRRTCRGRSHLWRDEVIRAPVSHKRLLDAVITYACTASAPALNPAMKRMVKRTGLKDVMSSPPETDEPADGRLHCLMLRSAAHPCTAMPVSAPENITPLSIRTLGRLIGKLQQLSVPHHNRALLAALVPLLAIFICFGGIVGFFFVSTGWSVPVELGRNHELVRQAGKQLEDLRNREATNCNRRWTQPSTLAAMAETTRNTASSQRLDTCRAGNCGEREQNARVLAGNPRTHFTPAPYCSPFGRCRRQRQDRLACNRCISWQWYPMNWRSRRSRKSGLSARESYLEVACRASLQGPLSGPCRRPAQT
jgi:hypothetical protein